MLALSRLAMTLDTAEDTNSLEMLQAAIPQMVEVLKQAVTEGDEDRTTQSFEVGRPDLSLGMNEHIDHIYEGFPNTAYLRLCSPEQALWRHCPIHDHSSISNFAG